MTEIFAWNFDPLYQKLSFELSKTAFGQISKIVTIKLYGEYFENLSESCFDSSKEASWCTECNAKTPSCLQGTDSEKNRNNLQKYSSLTKNTKKGNFLMFYLIFSVTIFFKEMGSFALRLVHQSASFELSNTAFGYFSKFSS